jgi:hypothetical protein
MNDPRINENLKGKTIVRVIPHCKDRMIAVNTEYEYHLETEGEFLIELSDGSFLKVWTSEWGGITIVNRPE